MNPYGGICPICGKFMKVIAIVGNDWNYVCPQCDFENGKVIIKIDDEIAVIPNDGNGCRTKIDFEEAEIKED